MHRDTKHVKQGVLVAASPSSIVAYDESSPFGCARRWHYEYVQGIKPAASAGQALGTLFHSAVERLIGGESSPDDSVKHLFLAAKPTVLEIVAEGIVHTEIDAKLVLAGIAIGGRVDVVTKTGVLDWKTSSDVARYAKTPGQLQRDTQMLLYAKWLALPGPTTIEHVYVQTRGRPLVERVRAKVTPQMLDAGIAGIIVKLEEMKLTAAELDITKIKADRSKCNRCPHNIRCPKDTEDMTSLLNRFKAASILPPDAPESTPALAAAPVAGFTPVEAPPVEAAPVEAPPVEAAPVEAPTTKRGRPAGAKNKVTLTPAPEATSTVELNTVTVSHGATINTGNFNSQRIDVSMSGRFTGDFQAAFEETATKVRTLLLKEVERVGLSIPK